SEYGARCGQRLEPWYQGCDRGTRRGARAYEEVRSAHESRYRAREAGDCPRSHQHRLYRCPRPQLRYGRAAEEDDRRDRDGIQAEGEPGAGDGLYRGLSAAGYRTDASEICQVTGVSCGVLPGALRSGSALVGAPKLGTPQIRGNDVHTFVGCPTDTDTNASL